SPRSAAGWSCSSCAIARADKSFVMSSHDTFIAGRLPRPHLRSSGLFLQLPAETQASHSEKVKSNLPAANGSGLVTLCTGFSSLSSSEPIINSPAGTTTISGHGVTLLEAVFWFEAALLAADLNLDPIARRRGCDRHLLAGAGLRERSW